MLYNISTALRWSNCFERGIFQSSLYEEVLTVLWLNLNISLLVRAKSTLRFMFSWQYGRAVSDRRYAINRFAH